MNKFMKKLMSKKEGFTLVELIVVIAILAILAGVAIPAYSGYIKKANNTADMTALSAIKTAAMAHYATEGEVTKIVVTDAATDTVAIYLNDSTTASTSHSTAGSDFLVYLNATTFSIDLKTGDVATWDNPTAAVAATKGEWVITPNS